MYETDPVAETLRERDRALFRGGEIDLLGFFDEGAHPEGALAAGDGAAKALDHFRQPFRPRRAGVSTGCVPAAPRQARHVMSP